MEIFHGNAHQCPSTFHLVQLYRCSTHRFDSTRLESDYGSPTGTEMESDYGSDLDLEGVSEKGNVFLLPYCHYTHGRVRQRPLFREEETDEAETDDVEARWSVVFSRHDMVRVVASDSQMSVVYCSSPNHEVANVSLHRCRARVAVSAISRRCRARGAVFFFLHRHTILGNVL